MITVQDYPGCVEFPRRFEALALGSDQIVQSSRCVVSTNLGIRMTFIIENLVFESEGRILGGIGCRHVLGHVVFDTAVSGRADFPFKIKLKIFICGDGYQVTADKGLSVFLQWHIFTGNFFYGAILDNPVSFGDSLSAQSSPSLEGLPVEQKSPALGLFLICEDIRSRCFDILRFGLRLFSGLSLLLWTARHQKS